MNRSACPISYILEPVGRNTAAAIAAAAVYLEREYNNEETILLISPADHVITDQKSFEEAVAQAVIMAQKGQFVTFGIKPERAETAYGYIEADNHYVVQFVEKPSVEKAEEYVQSGRFLWNSGMFLLFG